MKTTERKAIEYSDRFLNRTDDIFEWYCRYFGYQAGYETCEAEWLEKLKWNDVTQTLPEIKNEGYDVEVMYMDENKRSYNMHWAHIDNSNVAQVGWTHWRYRIE